MRKIRRWAYAAAAFLLVACLLRLWPAQALVHSAPSSRAFYASDGSLLRLTLAADGQYRLWTPLAQIDPRLVQAVQQYEDRWFAYHPGVNLISLVRGAWSSYVGSTRKGASTLSMQLARRLSGLRSGNLSGKFQQIAAAMWLELRHSKAELLEAYLNLVPYGGNIEGVGAASLVYFGRQAHQLSLPEILSLAVIPQNPNRRGAGNVLALQQARDRLWESWQKTNSSPASTGDETHLAPLLRSLKSLPFRAPHAVQTLLPQLPFQPHTTLSLHSASQAAVERAIAQFIERHQGTGIHNASALLVDSATMQVTAWVGSANYFDDRIDGQVNATTAKRSPGSTLKPFIYALGLEQGLLHPRSMLKDAPTAFGTYTPENFDGRFEGPITAQDALIKSRNVPAVQLSNQLKDPNLYEFLRRAGIAKLAPEHHYGLALSLGGGEVNMVELAMLYAMLANGGKHAPLRYVAHESPPPTQRLLSEEAAFITLEMLKRNPRPDTGSPAVPEVAWKTGTSWGFRDAWTAGVFGRQVLVVWVGNFDGTANPGLVGVKTAAPLFFNIIDSLRSQHLDGGHVAKTTPANVARVEVCAASGDLPNVHCKDLSTTWFIPGKSPIRMSTLHRPIWTEQATGRLACGPGPGIHTEIIEHWGTDMLNLFAQAGMPRRTPPPAGRCNSSALSASAQDGPQIVSPLRTGHYILRLTSPSPLALRANSTQSGPIYWFADSAFVGQAPAGTDLHWSPPLAGRYSLNAVDAQGASDSREVWVEFAP
jgi:penicillin-binding protein 1C